MRWTYLCPKCKAHLNANEHHIALVAERDDQRGLMMFDAAPGDYRVFVPRGLEVVEGDTWRFCCPVCGESLTVEHNRSLARITLLDMMGEHAVFFSRIAGERATFVAKADGAIDSYGDHKTLYEKLLWFKLF